MAVKPKQAGYISINRQNNSKKCNLTFKFINMKKLIFTLIAILGFAITSSAQQAATKKTEKATKEIKKIENKVVLKKDGTPDKRYKEAKADVVLKKDGTPDKRYTKKK